jgi:hypothetical protein
MVKCGLNNTSIVNCCSVSDADNSCLSLSTSNPSGSPVDAICDSRYSTHTATSTSCILGGIAGLNAASRSNILNPVANGPVNCGPNALLGTKAVCICSGTKFSASFATYAGYFKGASCHSITAASYGNYLINTCFNIVLGGANGCSGANNTMSVYTLTKAGGSFRIKHPDPSKPDKHLIHSFVESPTAGDNIYKYKINVQGCSASLDLPSYYKFLNCNDHIHLSPSNHFGKGYGVMNQEQTKIDFVTDTDGEYDVILIGTRKDRAAQNMWKGAERLKNPD